MFNGQSQIHNYRESSLIDSPESAVVKEAQSGSHSAFEFLYKQNVGKIFAVCLRLIADRTRAEELTQDVFVRAWENLNSFRGESLFSTWLYRLAVNVVLVDMRTVKRRSLRFSGLSSLLKFTKKTEHNHGDSIDLEKAVSTLPEKARVVFVLHDVEGYKHEEISEMLGIAEGTTKAQLHRARKLLREVLVK
ncbi:MAG: RNA polymerase sigma factor [Ignavibacteriales bacterium]|nr:MAG: RNA polymerase sigma factor [Ignavibacteriales bacterium]